MEEYLMWRSFVIAENSLSPLMVTHEMLTLILTYHQAMAPFVDLLLSFGQQEYAQDFHYTSFFAQSPVLGTGERQPIPELGRTSSVLQLCYNLKAPEQGSDKDHPWPWALRQAAVYQSLDLENGRATWVTVKANDVLAQRIAASNEIMNEAPSTKDNTSPFDVSLHESLASHLIICDWAAESWRWYINFLENRLQENSRSSLSVMADGDPKALDEWAKAPSTATTTLNDTSAPKIIAMIKRNTRSLSFKIRPKATPDKPAPVKPSSLPHGHHLDEASGLVFPFHKLQKIQDIGDKANEALLILKANTEVMTGLRSHYRALIDANIGLATVGESEQHVLKFERQIVELERILKMEQSRVEALLRLIEDRKNLVGR